ncbi:MAG: RIP metalloprotease RseP [Myxococcota bacterium]|nr:RIP metalloprotease RseP [Myxococcota bacterium]
MTYVLQNLHWFLLFITVLVFVHELGHFLVAKWCGVRVLKFSIGMGPRVVSLRRGGTEYAISLLPIGGFVKMLGDLPGAEIAPEEAPYAFNNKKVWQRAAIVAAGPVFNFVLALFVYFGMFTGQQTFEATRIGSATVGGPAWSGGLRPGDTILAVDGQKPRDYYELRELIGARPNATVTIAYERDGEQRVANVMTRAHDEANVFQEREARGRIEVNNRFVQPVVAIADKESPAGVAGVQSGDRIMSVDGKEVGAWHEVRALLASGDGPVRLGIRRGEQVFDLTVTPGPAETTLGNDLLSAADRKSGYTGLVSKESTLARVEADTPAAAADLRVGDRVIAVTTHDKDGHATTKPVNTLTLDLMMASDAHDAITLTVQRGRAVSTHEVKFAEREEKDDFKNVRRAQVFGAAGDPAATGVYTMARKVGPVEGGKRALAHVGEDMTLIVKGIAKIASGQLPMDSMGGPIMLFVIAEKSANSGLAEFLTMLAVISVNLGLINLVPVPVLDGGHLMFLAMEAIRRRPPSVRVREVANVVGLVMLLMLMVLVFKNDIVRFVLG